MRDQRRESWDRRAKERRRQPRRAEETLVRSVPWPEQRLQYIMRALFWVFALAYFNLDPAGTRGPVHLALINGALLLYAGVLGASILHARRRLFSPRRWRLAMWIDLGMVFLALIVDANELSPAYLAFLMVILGNGMRYGMRFFTEAVIGTFVLTVILVTFRFLEYATSPSFHLLFFAMFGAIFILYAYTLTAKLEQARIRLERESALDILTGLLNRRGLYERADGLIQSVDAVGRPLSVLFADLNSFKAVNDRFGHHAGDKVLKQIAQVFRTNSRDTDIVSRYGGDEFVLLLPDASVSDAQIVSDRLQTAVATWSKSNNIPLSVSIGLGGVPEDGRELHDILRQVDRRMYQDKSSADQAAELMSGSSGSGAMLN